MPTVSAFTLRFSATLRLDLGLPTLNRRVAEKRRVNAETQGLPERYFSSSNLVLTSWNIAFNFANSSSVSVSVGQTRWVYQELRDRKVAMFIDKLPEGVWQLSYEMRAEAPGTFHALPVLGHAMYVPEIRTNGAETRIKVTD